MIIGMKKIRKLIRGLNVTFLLIPIATFIFVCILSYKALTNKNKIDTYEEYFTIIESKDDFEVDLNYETDLIADKYKDME